MSATNMTCFSKLESIFHRVYPSIPNFPKHAQRTIGEDLTKSFLECLSYMTIANSINSSNKKKRGELLEYSQGKLHHIIFNWRFCRNNKFISKGFFEDIDELLTEVDKMLRGWIRSLFSR